MADVYRHLAHFKWEASIISTSVHVNNPPHNQWNPCEWSLRTTGPTLHLGLDCTIGKCRAQLLGGKKYVLSVLKLKRDEKISQSGGVWRDFLLIHTFPSVCSVLALAGAAPQNGKTGQAVGWCRSWNPGHRAPAFPWESTCIYLDTTDTFSLKSSVLTIGEV